MQNHESVQQSNARHMCHMGWAQFEIDTVWKQVSFSWHCGATK